MMEVIRDLGKIISPLDKIGEGNCVKRTEHP